MPVNQVLIQHGKAVVVEVPTPQVEPGTVLVAVKHSCISVGTEMSGVAASGTPLWKRALAQPEKIRQLVHSSVTEGLGKTFSRVQSVLTAGVPTGYSVAGEVLESGRGVDDLKPGTRVACAGSQYAYHAEIVRVPRNLVVSIPEGLSFAEASTVTLGAIALQGVRRTQPTLGECFVVIGLGILGQLTAQILKANGCRVIGTDVDEERVLLAKRLGLDMGLVADSDEDIAQVGRLTHGIGADGVIITASTSSDTVMSTAFKMCRKKGRVVLVGDVGLNLNRSDFYSKELDFLISTSYGPGRYDDRYEEQGLDYPVGYVRWTENRNMSEYLRLLADRLVQLQPLISEIYPVERAPSAYEALQTQPQKRLIVLLSYPEQKSASLRKVPNPSAAPARDGSIRIAVVGAGSFAKGTHLPNLKQLGGRYTIEAICSRSGHNAVNTVRQYGGRYATTDYAEVLADPEVEAVLIATRHHLHADMTLRALKAGKHVLVEKPLATTKSDLDRIVEFYAENPDGPVLLTGFNRRFSPHLAKLKAQVAQRSNPMVINYRMNVGYIPMDNWVHGDEGGGRNIGEACHIYDVFTFLTESEVREVHASSIVPHTAAYRAGDNFVMTASFVDGSVASLTYTALGSKDLAKERLELYVDGRAFVIDDYRSLAGFGTGAKGLRTRFSSKGQSEELVAFADSVKGCTSWPIPLWNQIQAMEMALAVETFFAR